MCNSECLGQDSPSIQFASRFAPSHCGSEGYKRRQFAFQIGPPIAPPKVFVAMNTVYTSRILKNTCLERSSTIELNKAMKVFEPVWSPG